MLDFRIATFLQLCETKSYTKTAKLLNITQPSVTQHIKYLQRKYQCKLFSYEGKTLRLTPEGEYLRRQAEAMTRTSARIAADLLRMSENNKALRLGCPKELGEATVTRITAKLLAEKYEISLCIKNTAELISLLENGQLDVVLADKEASGTQFASVPAGKVDFRGYAAPEEEFNGKSISLKKLTDKRLLLGEPGSSDRDILERCMKKHNLETEAFDSVMTCSTPACIQELAAANTGIFFGYASAVQDAVEQNRLQEFQISDLPEERSLVFLYSKENMNAEQFKPFFETFRTLWTETVRK